MQTWINLYFHGGQHNIVTVTRNPAWPAPCTTHSKIGMSAGVMLHIAVNAARNGYTLHSTDTDHNGNVTAMVLVKES